MQNNRGVVKIMNKTKEILLQINKLQYNNKLHVMEFEQLIRKYQIEVAEELELLIELNANQIEITPHYAFWRKLQKVIRFIGEKNSIVKTELDEWFEKELVNQNAQSKIIDTLDRMGYNVLVDKNKKDFLDLLDRDEVEDLDILLNNDAFKYELEQMEEGIDKKYNLDYIAEFKNESGTQSDKALEKLILANKKLVWKYVESYKKLVTPAFGIKDMYQMGMIGLIKAAEKFDLSRENKFSTYATYWIRQGILRGIANYSTTIRVPVHKREEIRKYLKQKEQLSGAENISQLAEQLDLPEQKVIEFERYKELANLTSLDTPISDEKDSYLGEFIEDRNTPSPEMVVSEHELRRIVLESLDIYLTQREENVILLRYGFLDGKNHTLEEIGKVLGVTRERIRQIEQKALRRLKRSSKLKEFRYAR